MVMKGSGTSHGNEKFDPHINDLMVNAVTAMFCSQWLEHPEAKQAAQRRWRTAFSMLMAEIRRRQGAGAE